MKIILVHVGSGNQSLPPLADLGILGQMGWLGAQSGRLYRSTTFLIMSSALCMYTLCVDAVLEP